MAAMVTRCVSEGLIRSLAHASVYEIKSPPASSVLTPLASFSHFWLIQFGTAHYPCRVTRNQTTQ